MLDRSVWALEASALALAASAWVLAASAPYRSGRHGLPSALPAGRRDRQRAVRRARPTGSGPVPGALGETGTPPGRHGCLPRRPRKQNRWPLSGSPCRIDTDRSRPHGRARLARLCRICSVSLPRLWHEQRTSYYEGRRNFNILNVGSLDVVQIRRSTEQYIFLPTPSL